MLSADDLLDGPDDNSAITNYIEIKDQPQCLISVQARSETIHKLVRSLAYLYCTVMTRLQTTVYKDHNLPHLQQQSAHAILRRLPDIAACNHFIAWRCKEILIKYFAKTNALDME